MGEAPLLLLWPASLAVCNRGMQQQQEVEELRERGCIAHPEERLGSWAAGFVISSPFWAPLPGSYKQALRAA